MCNVYEQNPEYVGQDRDRKSDRENDKCTNRQLTEGEAQISVLLSSEEMVNLIIIRERQIKRAGRYFYTIRLAKYLKRIR